MINRFFNADLIAQNWIFEKHVHIWTEVENPNFEAQNGPKIWAYGAYLLLIHKSSSNELLGHVLSESSGNFLRIQTKTYILTHLGDFWYTSESPTIRP